MEHMSWHIRTASHPGSVKNAHHLKSFLLASDATRHEDLQSCPLPVTAETADPSAMSSLKLGIQGVWAGISGLPPLFLACRSSALEQGE